MRLRSTCLTLVAALLCALGLGGVATASAARPPVVLIVMDEFPTVALMNQSGGISASRFPNFYRLSREGVWYRNHTTVSSLTRQSVPGILTGNYVEPGDAFATTGNFPASIFTYLHSRGYKVDALESATQICPRLICPLRRLDPTHFADSMEFQNARVRQVWDQTRNGLIAAASREKFKAGTFTFRHFLIPHHPYDHVPSGQFYKSGPIPLIYAAENMKVNAPIGNLRLSYQRLMLQVGYADRVIGELRKAALRQGKWKSMMLVVVGDHGFEHRPGRLVRTFQPDNAGDIAFAPLFIKYPGKTKGGISNLTTRGTDVFPTIARALGGTVPVVDGEPITQMGLAPRDVSVDGQSMPFSRAVRDRRNAVVFKDRLLGRGGLFRMGRGTHLIGLKVGGKPSGKARLDRAAQYRSIDRKRKSAPALITGVTPTLRAGSVVAISVNGVIRATAEVFAAAGRRRFGAMVNPRFFRPKNEIGIYQVKDGRVIRRLR